MNAPGRAAAVTLLLLATPAAAGAAEGGAPCEVRIAVEPQRAYVGQAVEHRRIVVRREGVELVWSEPPRFPGFRSEPLGAGSARRIESPGPAAVRTEQPTLLFPARAGRLALPPARLRCDGREIEVAGPAVDVRPWPAAGRPAGFSGVVGAVSVEAAADASVTLGGSVRVHVTSRGAANLWDAEPSLRVDPPDTEVFARPPRVALHGGERRLVVRHDVFDLVPRRAGRLRVAPLRLPWLDPASGRYAVAESPALEIRVLPAPAAGAATSGEAERPAAERAWGPGRGEVGGGLARALGGAVVLAGAAAAAWAVARRRRAAAADPVAAPLRDFDRAESPDARAAALERALRACLAAHGAQGARARGAQGARAREAEDALEGSPDPQVAEWRAALAEVERVRFAGAGAGDLAGRLDALRAQVERTRPGPGRGPPPSGKARGRRSRRSSGA